MKSISKRRLHQLRSLQNQIFERRGELASFSKIVSERLSKHISIMGIFRLVCLNTRSIRKLQ